MIDRSVAPTDDDRPQRRPPPPLIDAIVALASVPWSPVVAIATAM